jgi:hypothetical protein
VTVPEFVPVAFPPAAVSVATLPLTVPEFVVVAFWLAPVAVLLNDPDVPEFVQLTPADVVVQTNCALAGELASTATTRTVPTADETRHRAVFARRLCRRVVKARIDMMAGPPTLRANNLITVDCR